MWIDLFFLINCHSNLVVSIYFGFFMGNYVTPLSIDKNKKFENIIYIKDFLSALSGRNDSSVFKTQGDAFGLN